MESRQRSGIEVIAFGALALCCWLGPEPAPAAEQSQVQAPLSGGSAPSRPSLIRPHRQQQKATAPSHKTPASTIRSQANSLINRPASDEIPGEETSIKATGSQQRETGTGAATTSPALPNGQALKPVTGLTASPPIDSTTGNSAGTGATGSIPAVSSRGVSGLIKRFPEIAPSLAIAPTPVPSPAPGQNPSPPNFPSPGQTPVPTPSPSPSVPQTTVAVGSVTLTWQANREQDLAGYKIYVGASSGSYTYAGSPFMIGNATAYTLSALPKGQTYFFAISAYDTSGNESGLSSEVSKTLY